MTAIALPQWSPAAPRDAFASPYVAYVYSYPHKTAYRPLLPPRLLRDVWAQEDKSALYLYLHVPFCEMRCGFCNLFTTANPQDDMIAAYMTALTRQAQRIRDAIGEAHYARMAIGGGTPTYLSLEQLDQILTIARDIFGVDLQNVPISVETSPRTAETEKLQLLRAHGVDRISIGVQSFIEPEVASSGRAQKNEWVEQALDRIRTAGFPTLNIDLIYGLPGQTVATWLQSLRAALRWRPEELYLYPLYVRPLTGLERRGVDAADDVRLDCYRAGRELLLSEGYEQISMRMFARRRAAAGATQSPVYCCQEDGMVGLGCGARSYTQALHYSNDYAVGNAGVREIITRYCAADETFDRVDYGCELDEGEQRRRYVIKSLLRVEGLDLAAYRSRFGGSARTHFPELQQLLDRNFIAETNDKLTPTAAGVERSDGIGPFLYSTSVRRTMQTFELR
jgi:oxygen-independent coproporphyrinogen-3 oxidase